MKQDDIHSSTGQLVSEVDNTPGYIYLRFAAEHLDAAGFEDTLNIVNALYQQCLPNEEEYQAEIAILEEYYFSAREKALYFEIIAELSGNDEKKYAQLYGRRQDKRGQA